MTVTGAELRLPEYLSSLTPPVNNLTNITTLDSLFLRGIPRIAQTWYPNGSHFSNTSATLVPFVEHVISTLVVDGIARTGSYLQRSPIETLMSFTMNPAYTATLFPHYRCSIYRQQ